MNDHSQTERLDPFAQGRTAHGAHLLRVTCPFPEAFVEARRWMAGWDHAASGVGAPGSTVVEIRGARRERAWSREELVVLRALAGSGERLSELASRLSRTRDAISSECARQSIKLSEEQVTG